jgi:hypothetical protein
LFEKHKEKTLLRRPRHRCGNDVKTINLVEIDFEDVEWVYLV